MYRALFLLTHDIGRATALIVMRDLDHIPARRRGFAQALKMSPPDCVVVAGFPNPEVEAWFLSGLKPADSLRHEQLCRELHFDPCEAPHRLSSTKRASPDDAKRVWRELGVDDDAVVHECLSAPFEVLRRRGAGAGVGDFLDELERIAALFGAVRPAS